MFINQIDETYEKILNILYDTIINKNLLKFFKTNNLFINNFGIINEYINNLKDVIKNDVMGIFNKNTNIEYIIDKIIEYLYIYIFLLYGFYELNNDIFLNTIYSIIKKNEKLFNNDYILKLQICHKNLLKILEYLKNKTNDEYVINLLKGINEKVLENKNNNHNIILIIIFKDIYLKEDKKNLYKILENEEISNAEIKYIEIVEVDTDNINYTNLERLFNETQKKNGLVEEFYNLMIDYNNEDLIVENNINKKINILFERKIIIPIVEDYIRINKENEFYDKGETTKININERVFKKNETKIKYIITKLNKLSNLYEKNENRDEIIKNYYQNILNRDAILRNDFEEIDIIKKIERQNLSDIISNEYYDDLINYRHYPYNSYKSLSKDGIYFKSDKVIPCLRYTNFKYINDDRFINNRNDLLEWRVLYPEQKVNIVGVALLNHNIINKVSYFECNKINDLKNVNSIYKNGYKVILHRLEKMIMEDKNYGKILYWLFNVENDIVYKKYFKTIINSSDYINNLFYDIYEELNTMTKNLIKNELIDINGEVNKLIQLSDNIENNLIPLNNKQKNDIYKYIYYEKCNLDEIKYDENENKIPGISKNIIKLPSIIYRKKEIPLIKISDKDNDKYDDEDEKLFENTICQHIISWNYLNTFKFFNPKKYNQLLLDFMNNYTLKNNDNEYLCKSCYETLEIKDFISSWDDNTNNIIINYNLNTNLDEIYEYSKYNKFIKNLDKLIEKITYVSGLKYYSSSSPDIKLKRQNIIRNMIDIIDLQYKTLFNKNYNLSIERIKSSGLYKFNKDLSTYFLFSVDNDIFTYSSKETDKFKKIKLNIIYCYLIYFLLIDLNEVQISVLSYDKFINFMFFEKYGYSLFDNILIRIVNSDKLVPIKNYKLLCYIIYYLTGIIIKYGLWFDEDIEYKKNNPNILLHKKIIHTFIHLINNLFETNFKYNNYIYQMSIGKFYQIIKLIYSIDEITTNILNHYKKLTSKKMEIVGVNIKINIIKLDTMKVIKINYDDNEILKTYFNLLEKRNINSYCINKYKIIKKRSDIINIENINKNLLQKIIIDNIKIYNYDGTKRNNPPLDNEIKDILNKDFNLFFKNIYEKRIMNINKLNKNNEKLYQKEMKYIDKYTNKFKNIKSEKNIDIVIDEFINYLEKFVQKNYNINNVYLRNNVYIINHDYNGYHRDNIYIKDIENKIIFNKNNTIFKQDIYYYLDIKTNVIMYYSVLNNQFIGYKEKNNEIVLISNSNNYLKINYSIKHKLLYLGYNYMFNKVDENTNVIEYVNKLFNIRLNNLKNCINETLQIIFKIKNKNKYDNSIKQFTEKINYLNIYDDNLNRIFNEWNKLQKIINVEKIDDKIIIDKIIFDDDIYISSISLLKIKNSIHNLIYYYINNLRKLIELQDNEFIQNNVCILIINIINNLFIKYNLFETTKKNIYSKQFLLYISSKARFKELSLSMYDIIEDTNDLSNDEIDELREKQMDDKEALDALDIDNEMDNKDELDYIDEDMTMIRNKED